MITGDYGLTAESILELPWVFLVRMWQKSAADMILTDVNFASIVHAVEQGRAVYNNIRKFLLYILNSNMPEAVLSAFFLFSKGAIPLPLTIMQILFIDLGTDLVPALGLGSEEPEKGIMEKPPRNLMEPLLKKKSFLRPSVDMGY